MRKFLDGLRDNDTRFEIEYNKEPEDIDEAVYHAVNFIQTRRRSNPDTYMEKSSRNLLDEQQKNIPMAQMKTVPMILQSQIMHLEYPPPPPSQRDQ